MNSSSVLIIAFICIAIGYFAGVLISYLVNNRSKPDDQVDQPIQADVISTERTLADQVRLSHAEGSQNLVVDLEGTRISRPADVNPEQEERLVTWLAEYQAFLRAVKLDGIQNKVVTVSGAQKPEGQSDNLKEVIGAQPEPLPVLQPTGTYLPPTSKPAKPAAAQSIVSQIDEILQQQIDGTHLAERGVRLAEQPGHGVTVWIGIQQFMGVDEVDDSEVKNAIRKAVRTWELKAR